MRISDRLRASDVRAGQDEGASAVEFALVLPILVLLLVGIVQFGQAFNAYLAVTHAAREGARLASVGKFSAAEVAARAEPLTAADGLQVVGPMTFADAGYGESVGVTVLCPYIVDIPLWGTVSVPLQSTARMRKE